MSTLAQIVDRTKQKLSGYSSRDRVNILNTTVNSSTTSIVCKYTPGAETTAGGIIEIDFEQMMIVSIAGSTLTVIRGWNGTTATSHTADAVIYVEPRLPRSEILAEVIAELRAVPQTIYKTTPVVLTFTSGSNQVDLTGASGTVLRIVNAERTGFDGASYPSFRPQLRLIRNANTTDFPSGYAVQLEGGLSYGEDAIVRVVYASELTVSSLSSATDLQATVGLPISAEDILVYGAASRLLYSKESDRVDFTRQGVSRAAEEVPIEANARQAQRWRLEADRRISEEAMRLVALWGIPGA